MAEQMQITLHILSTTDRTVVSDLHMYCGHAHLHALQLMLLKQELAVDLS